MTTHFALFRLWGHMASWGTIAPGEYKNSVEYPTRSAILGLVAAALGYQHQDPRHRQLHEGLLVASRIDRPGIILRDYHTVHQAPEPGKREVCVLPTRREELKRYPSYELQTTLTRREYLNDAVYTVALYRPDTSSAPTLQEISQAFASPVFIPYIGRKSCPVGLPIRLTLSNGATLREALTDTKLPDYELSKQMRGSVAYHAFRDPLAPVRNRNRYNNPGVRIIWDDKIPSGYEPLSSFDGKFSPVDRVRRTFESARMHAAAVAPEEAYPPDYIADVIAEERVS